MDEPEPSAEQALRATVSPTLANDWSLVLASTGINHTIVEGGGVFSLVVAVEDAAPAAAALAAFDVESVPKVVPPAPDLGPSALGVVAGAALLAMFLVTRSSLAMLVDTGADWSDVGRVSGDEILHGQWWRVVTALTLHEDVLHLVGNVLACLIFVSAVGRWLGPGLGALLIVGCAAIANGLDVVWHRHEPFASLGASTATFAATGLIVGLQLYRRWRYDERRRYFWLPLGAGLALYAMLGSAGEHVDRGAHVFGLAVGAVVGTAVARTAGARPAASGRPFSSPWCRRYW